MKTTLSCMYQWRPYLCPSPTVPNLSPNEHESTIQVGSSDHSWLFEVIRAMTMDSNNVLLVRVASAGKYEVFEHVQKVCVPSTNNLDSWLCALRTCSYCVCRTTYVLYSNRFSLYTTSFVHVHFRVRMWLDREEEDRVVFLLFSYYTWKVREWFALSFALVIVPILTHTCWIRAFSCAS